MRKDVYPDEVTDVWKKFNENQLPEIEELCSNLNLKHITEPDDNHAKQMCKDFEIKYLNEYHDLYLKSDTLYY